MSESSSDVRTVDITNQCHDAEALIDRLSAGIRKRQQEVVFLVGSPFSAPTSPGSAGVPGVEGIIALIRREFEANPAHITAFDSTIRSAGAQKYHAAFRFLQGRFGPQAANDIVREAVRSARLPTAMTVDVLSDDNCQLIESDTTGWCLNPGTVALAELINLYPSYFGKTVLTTNFDPLLEIAITRNHGVYFRTTLHSDGNINQTTGTGCHIVHLHGYWYGSDTLHTSRQLEQQRPRLRASLSAVLRNKVVVVCGYGGWDDAFTDALMQVVRDDSAYPEILWTFQSPRPNVAQYLYDKLLPGIDRGRVNLYANVDCNEFLPRLVEVWSKLEPARERALPSAPMLQIQERLVAAATYLNNGNVLEGDDEDRPPLVDICVGRDGDLERVRSTAAKVVFLTGMGGQGKSTVAARYFLEAESTRHYDRLVWRDCKEESEVFEIQLASVVEALSDGRVHARDLANQDITSIIDMLFRFLDGRSLLFVFDNADHYVNLETRKLTGSAAHFVQALISSDTASRALFTCRPMLSYDERGILNCHLEGLGFSACRRLFSERGARCSDSEVADALELTGGHAFWLDLLAIQTAKRAPELTLSKLLNEIRSGSGLLPDTTLASIWATLKDRERTVLRALAEVLKPEAESEVADYLSGQLTYNKVSKALQSLRALNLVVIKRSSIGSDLIELHPVVRQFIKRNFDREEQLWFVKAIIRVYRRLRAKHKGALDSSPSLTTLKRWTEEAELDAMAGQPGTALATLAEVAQPFKGSAFPREYCRVTRLVLASFPWVLHHHKFRDFEKVFETHIDILSHLGETAEVDRLLLEYQQTVPERSARYIYYCDLMCSSLWIRGKFDEAIKWGNIGQELKDSGVDTDYGVAHHLALAQRDAGRPEIALPVFLGNYPLEKVLDVDLLIDERGGHFYGNIGRCLHLMGQLDRALICYQKSAVLVEKEVQTEHVLNQGYIRNWIAELLVARGEMRLAVVFFTAAYLKWEHASPRGAQRIRSVIDQLRKTVSEPIESDPMQIEQMFLDWISGRLAPAGGKKIGFSQAS